MPKHMLAHVMQIVNQAIKQTIPKRLETPGDNHRKDLGESRLDI